MTQQYDDERGDNDDDDPQQLKEEKVSHKKKHNVSHFYKQTIRILLFFQNNFKLFSLECQIERKSFKSGKLLLFEKCI